MQGQVDAVGKNDNDLIYIVRNNKLRKGLTDAFFSESFEEFGQ